MRLKVIEKEREGKLSISIKNGAATGSEKQEPTDGLIDLPGGSGTKTFEDKEVSDFLFDICLIQLLLGGVPKEEEPGHIGETMCSS